MRILFHITLTVSIFSLWAIFALTIINPYFYQDVPGYQIGRICIWEVIFLIFAAISAFLIGRKWGYPEIKKVDNVEKLTIHPFYGKLLVLYFCILVGVGIWQFYIFSQQF